MPLLLLKDLPRYECLLEAAERYPSLDPTACEAFLHLLRTGDDVAGAERRFLAGRGVSPGRFTVLMLLHRKREEPCTPASLADEAGVTRATMTGLIDTLEKDGLALRDTDSSDRRTIQVRLTPHGRESLEQMLPDYFACVSAIMQPLSEAERRQLVRLFQKVQQKLATTARDRAPAQAETDL